MKSLGAWAYLCNGMFVAHLLGCYVREGYAIIAFYPGPGATPSVHRTQGLHNNAFP